MTNLIEIAALYIQHANEIQVQCTFSIKTSWKHPVNFTDADVDLALDGSLVQRGVIPVVSGVGIGPVLQEQVDDVSVTKRAGVVERDEATIIAGVHVCSVLKEVVHHISTAKTCHRRVGRHTAVGLIHGPLPLGTTSTLHWDFRELLQYHATYINKTPINNYIKKMGVGENNIVVFITCQME